MKSQYNILYTIGATCTAVHYSILLVHVNVYVDCTAGLRMPVIFTAKSFPSKL